MSNRIVAFLTLIVIFLLAGTLAWWYFSQWVSQIVLHISGPKTSSVTLQKGGSTMLETSCTDQECVIDRIPPFTYNLRVFADGYIPYLEDIDVKSNSIIERTIVLKKDIRLQEFHTQDAGIKIARKNAVSAIESASGIVIGSFSDKIFFFAKKSADSYELKKMIIAASVAQTGSGAFRAETDMKSANTIQTFTTVDTPTIFSFNESDGLAGLAVGKDSLIFDAKTEKISIFLGAHPESSAGDGISNRRIHNISRSKDSLIVSTDVGAVIVNASNTVTHPLYDDIFTLPDGQLLGLVRSASFAKKSLLSLPDDQESYIFLEKQYVGRSIVVTTSTELDHFATEESQILVVDTDGGKSVIENITK